MTQGMAMMAAPEALAAATADPSQWTIPQGEEATRRHIRDGLKAGDIDPSTGKKVLYWHDPMVPGQKFDKPGKSPFMDMQLLPKYADEAGDAASVKIDPGAAQNLGMRLAVVTRAALGSDVRATGVVGFASSIIAAQCGAKVTMASHIGFTRFSPRAFSNSGVKKSSCLTTTSGYGFTHSTTFKPTVAPVGQFPAHPSR